MVTKKKSCGCKKKAKKTPRVLGLYGGGKKYHSCVHNIRGKCVHPMIGDRKRGGSGICRYTAETEKKCPGYW